MTKEQILSYIRTQIYFLNELAQQIEADKEVTIAWAVDMELPEEFKQEIVNRLGKEELNHECVKAIERNEVA